MRLLFERSLVNITDNLLRLSSMADQAIGNAMRALVERNAALAAQVSANDAQLNTLRYNIEEDCYNVIATQHPTASDLRVIVGAVSVATNLERIGDHAAGIARLSLRIIDMPYPKPLVDIPQMAIIGREMVKSAVESFLKRNVALAEQIIQRDYDVGILQNHAYAELVALMTESPHIIERATFLLWVAHHLERIGDRATNICERAIYVATGVLKELPNR